jgi:micrococcal nuclease
MITTASVILGMFILHRWVDREIQPDIASKSALTLSVQAEAKSPSTAAQSLPSRGPFRVTRVLDGDTIVLNNGERVRLIGVDAPEIHHTEIPVQRFAEEATEFLRRLAEGFACTLEYEPGNMRDQYGRLLAYVFVEGRLANAEIIRQGYAYAYLRFPFRRQAEFVALEREARGRQQGLWSLSLRDGRIANLVKRYDSLSIEGRKRLDEILQDLVQKYPPEQEEHIDSLTREGRK